MADRPNRGDQGAAPYGCLLVVGLPIFAGFVMIPTIGFWPSILTVGAVIFVWGLITSLTGDRTPLSTRDNRDVIGKTRHLGSLIHQAAILGGYEEHFEDMRRLQKAEGLPVLDDEQIARMWATNLMASCVVSRREPNRIDLAWIEGCLGDVLTGATGQERWYRYFTSIPPEHSEVMAELGELVSEMSLSAATSGHQALSSEIERLLRGLPHEVLAL
jgi:hypothetical protein